jgi:hypothetical protein
MRAVRSSSIAPGRPRDVVYLVLDEFGPPIGQAYREADPGEDDEAYVIHNLMAAQYSRPQRIVAFSVAAEGWAGRVMLPPKWRPRPRRWRDAARHHA